MPNDVNFNVGAILLGANNHPNDGNNHYIVYFTELDGFDFIGGMITTKAFNGKNVSMSPLHFEVKNNTDGSNCPISYYNSHLVSAKLHKFNAMGPFTKVGQLTSEGIAFMTSVINDKPLMSWDEYRNS